MSLLDMDERLHPAGDKIELVYSPLVDAKQFPEERGCHAGRRLDQQRRRPAQDQADPREHQAAGGAGRLRRHRQHSLDAHVFPLAEVLERVYDENATSTSRCRAKIVPALLERVMPLHEVVDVDVFIPGCPPSADNIFFASASCWKGACRI